MLPGAPYTKENTHIRVSHCHVVSLLYTSSPHQNPDFLSLTMASLCLHVPLPQSSKIPMALAFHLTLCS